ncbi:hypothetical protein Droror1_Dr00001266 [Drosera rotundifolia]
MAAAVSFLPTTSFLHKPTQNTQFKQANFTTLPFASYKTSSSSRSSPISIASSSSSSMATTLYQVLGVPATASGYEIKRAYRNLARTCHPDVVAMNQKDNSADMFIKIHDAYTTLSDPAKRASYDRDLVIRSSGRRGGEALTSVGRGESSRFSGYSMRRNWETDQCW